MGRVYLTFDLLLRRWVAVKEANRASDAEAALQREARLTASLDHPGVVAVHDLGQTEAGAPFYAMRLVRGRTLGAVLAERTATAPRLALLTHFRDACHAVGYAHAQGVIHRDIKPPNLLIGEFGETQVVDWGLAARVDEALPAVLGTPAWMAPEQARGEAATRATDVWGLGAVLYQILSNKPPFPHEDTDAALDAARAARFAPIAQAAPHAPADLRAIVDKALQPQPADRYPDARALAEDVERYLTGDRVRAHPYSPLELLQRTVRAWRVPLAVGAVGLSLLFVGGLWSGARLAAERDRAWVAEAEAERSLTLSLVTQARQAAWAGATGPGAVLGQHVLRSAEHPDARGAVLAALSQWPARRVSATPVVGCPAPTFAAGSLLCHDENELWRQVDGVEVWRVPLRAVDVTPSGQVIAVQAAREVVALRLDDGVSLGVFPRRSILPLVGTADGRFANRRWEGELWSGGLAPASQRLHEACEGHGVPRESTLHPTLPLHASWCADGWVAISEGNAPAVHLPTGLEVGEHGDASHLVWSADGSTLGIGYHRGRIALLNRHTGAVRDERTPGTAGVAEVAFSPDGRLIASRLESGGVDVWTAGHFSLVASLPVQGVRALDWDEAGRLRTLSDRLEVWSVQPRVWLPTRHEPLGLSGLSFSPDGETLLATHSDGLIVGWPTAGEGPRFRRVLGKGTVMTARYAPDRPRIFATTGEDSLLHRLDLDGASMRPAVRYGARALMPLPDDRVLALSFEDHAERVEADGQLTRLRCPNKAWRTESSTADGELGLVGALDGELWWVRGGDCAEPVVGVSASRAQLAPDGSWFLAANAAGLARHQPDGHLVWRTALDAANAIHLAVSADGRWAAAAGLDQGVRVFDATDGRLLATLRGHTKRVSALSFSPDGALLASGSWDGTSRLWALEALDQPVPALSATLASYGWPTMDELLGAR